jgi:hypothetical protein
MNKINQAKKKRDTVTERTRDLKEGSVKEKCLEGWPKLVITFLSLFSFCPNPLSKTITQTKNWL